MSNNLGPKHYQKIENLEEKLVKLQDIYVDGDIDRDYYLKGKQRYQILLSELKEKEAKQNEVSYVLSTYKNGLKKLNGIDLQYVGSDIEYIRRLVGSMFPKKFQFEKNRVRTADINPILLKISSINKGLQRNKKRDKSNNNDLSHDVLKAGLEPARSKEHWILSPTCLPIPPLQPGIFLQCRAKDGI